MDTSFYEAVRKAIHIYFAQTKVSIPPLSQTKRAAGLNVHQ
jgi:hypothetical protein